MSTRGVVFSLGVAAVCGCGASGEVKGGELRAPSDSVSDAATSSDASVVGASTWASLYADYFGPKGAASCTSSGTCHGDASQTGGRKSGFICGATEGACYDGMLAADLVPAGGSSEPSQVNLRFVLRTSAGGSMPKASSFVFSEGDLARIDAWVRSGAAR